MSVVPRETNKKIADWFLSKEVFSLEYHKDLDSYQTKGTPDDLSLYYKSEQYLSHQKNKSLVSLVYQAFKAKRNRWKKSLILKSLSGKPKAVLDVGCGDGSFLAQFKPLNVLGVEVSKAVQEELQNKGLKTVTSISEVSGSFDVISCWHSLEHINDPLQALKKMRSCLSSEGLLFVAIPNFKSFDAEFYKEYWAGYDVPRHLWHLSSYGMISLASQAGFELKFKKRMFLDAFFVSLLSEQYRDKSKPVALLSAFLVGLYSNLKSLFTGESSAVLYVFSPKA